MDKDTARQFIRMLQPNAPVVDNGEWLNTSCPLARWTHSGGTDNSPSFGIYIADQSTFHCWGCGLAGPLTRLIELLEEKSGDDYSELAAEVGDSELYAPGIRDEWVGDRERITGDALGDPLDPEVIEWYPSLAGGHPYLDKRGVLPETASDLGLRLDPNNRGAERILFPVYTADGVFYGFTGRATARDVVPKVRDYHGLDKRLLLLGSHLCERGSGGLVVLVEGLFDYAIVSQRGYPTVASMGANLTAAQADILKDIGLPVVIFYDDDKAGYAGRRAVAKRLAGHVPLLGVDYSREILEGYPENVRHKMDPGKLKDEDIDQMIEEAVLL